jgi:hypothetical protein
MAGGFKTFIYFVLEEWGLPGRVHSTISNNCGIWFAFTLKVGRSSVHMRVDKSILTKLTNLLKNPAKSNICGGVN